MIKFRAAAKSSLSSILLYVLIFEILSFSQISADKLVGLNGDSQNSRYVEIRRSPGNRRPIDVPSIDSMPKAHGLSQYGSDNGGNSDNEQIRRSPTSPPQQQQQQSTNGNGFSSPFASMIPGMPSFGNNNNNMNNLFQFPMHHHPLFTQSNNNPMQNPSIQLPQHPIMHLSQLPSAQQQHSPAQSQTATLSPIPLQTPIPTLSATLHPAFTLLPTLPTISFPTFPPFTMPPAFDQMASGYTKKKRRHKSRRKAPKKVYSTESNDDGTAEEQQSHERMPIKKRPSKKTLEKVESRLPKYANNDLNNGSENVENLLQKQEKWMVPYYGGSKKQKS
uniref:Uncharacterized protein n=1 Tax=Panagrolaimus sp. PS1159 TaxID=55785 RepID=A0AC35GJ57_9BILA